MLIDPRLHEIDDALYRVAVRALVIQGDRLLVVKEVDGGDWWAIPGGGVDYGESLKECLLREIEEELGVPGIVVESDFQISHYNIGNVVNGVPRMNVFFKASLPEQLVQKTSHVEKWAWVTKNEFQELDMNPSYNKAELCSIVFG